MLKIGLTGGIGSGKSTICRVFSLLGIPIYTADIEARRLMNENKELKAGIIATLGKEAYQNGVLNRPFVANVIFNNHNKLNELNGLVHPVVRKDFINWLALQNSPYVIQEAAILFESGAYRVMDKNIIVDAPIETRIKRVLQRDNTSKEKVQERLNNQKNTDELRPLADFVVYNNDKSLILPQIINIDKKLRRL